MSLRIVFMGTPEFAVPALRTLVEADYDVVGVITATDKYGGRGGKRLLQSAVKRYAVSQGIPVLQPKNLKAADFQVRLRELAPDLQIVVAFRMLPESVWALPPLGTFNLHGSLLPKYRGAAPINWAVINGEPVTGVTTFFLRQEIDTGAILLQRSLPIGPEETAGEVHDRMMELGAQTVLDTVRLIESGEYTPQPQDDSAATAAPKIYHETCRIDWVQNLDTVHNFVRGLSPYPTAWTTLDGQQLKVFRGRREPVQHSLEPGTLVTDGKETLKAACADGFLHLLEIQLQGRRRMAAGDFLNGYRLDTETTIMLG
jgi:methionyl-tRNA formyltransferase